MRMRFLLAGGIVLAGATAFGAGSIISSYRQPHSTYAKGLDYHAGYMYHVTNANTTCYQTTTTGSIVRSITFPSTMRGVHFTGSYFWTSDNTRIFRLTTTGSIVSTISTAAAWYGLAFDGTYLWGSNAVTQMITKLTTTGSVITSFKPPGTFCGDMDWDGSYLWLCDWPTSGGLYRMTTTGSVVESYVPPPGPTTRPSGCCWDGNYLWFRDYSSPYYVYQMDTVTTSILPASLGKIKSIYR
jgi:hypothetical protein